MKSMHFFILSLFFVGLSASLCNFDVRLLQELHNQGFHRNITYKVTIRDTYEDSLLYDNCYVALDQILPAGVYASPDELGDLRRMNKLVAIPKNRVNVELPAEESQPTSVYIISKVKDGEANLWLPVHARYHRAAKGGGVYRNQIDPPRIFIRCLHRQLTQCEPQTPLVTFLCSGSGRETCIWKEIYVTMLTNPQIFFPVPIGDLDHNNIVMPVTVGAVVIFSLYLLKTLHEYKLTVLKKGNKS